MKWWLYRSEPVHKAALYALAMNALFELSRSRDGYEREAVVAELRQRNDPRAVRALLVCCGDWVPQVRHAAQQGLRQFMRDDCIAHWAVAWPELAFLQRVRRADLGTLLTEVEGFIAAHLDAFEQQAQKLCGPDFARQRWSFGLRLKQDQPEAERAALLREHVCSSDLPLARRAVQAARRLTPDESQSVFEAALRSRLPRIRMAAARALLRLPAVDAQTLLCALCFDDSAPLRALAAALLSQGPDKTSGRDAVIARAVQTLDAPDATTAARRHQAIALHALSLLDKPAALARAAQQVQAQNVTLRRLARSLRLLALQADELDDEMLAALADRSAKVRRLAVELVQRGMPPPSAERLIALGRLRPELEADILAVLRIASAWDWLGYALERLGEIQPTPASQHVTLHQIQGWVAAQCFVDPDARQRAWLAALWTGAGGQRRRRSLVPAGQAAEIEARLHAFGVL